MFPVILLFGLIWMLDDSSKKKISSKAKGYAKQAKEGLF